MKIKVNKKKTAIIIFILVVIFICGNAFAALIGAPNVFFAIKNLTKDDVEVTEKEQLLIEEEKKEDASEASDEIAKSLFEKGSQKIRETQYTDYSQYEAVQPTVEKTIDGVKYQKRDVLYSDVEKEYSEIFTGEALKNVLGKRFAEVDGDLYVSYGGATGWDVTDIEVSKVSEKNNEIEYTVTYKDVNIDDSVTEEKSCKMIVEFDDGNYRISSTNYCNIVNEYEKENGTNAENYVKRDTY